MAGMDCNPLGLYPKVSYPVSRGTPMISPMIQWDHEQSWDVPTLDQLQSSGAGGKTGCVFEINCSEDSPDHYVMGHAIDGRVLYPATGYLVLVWRALAKITGQMFEKLPVVLEDIQIHRATIIPKTGMRHIPIVYDQYVCM